MASLDPSLLAGLPPFGGMSRAALIDFVAKAKSARIEKGSQIFGQGEPADHFFLLLDGYVRVVKITPGGEQIIVRYIAPGELLGIANAIGRDTYPANAIATDECIVLSWPGSIWQSTVEQYPDFATNTYRMIGDRLQDAHERIIEMATERVEQRVAHALMKLIGQSGKKTEEGILIDFPISRQDISEMTGTTLHTVSRLLSAWEQDGVVKSGRQRVMVTNGDELSLLAERNRGGM